MTPTFPSPRASWGLAVAAVALMAAWMLLQGRPALSPSGRVMLWYGDPWGPEGSQQVLDWYSPSHLIHGILFFGLLWLVARRLPVWASVTLVLGLEALTVWLIRDGLALNVLMLLGPLEAVRGWQAGAMP